MAPCNYLHKVVDPEGLEVNEKCISDPEAQFEYLSSSLQMRILYNGERFDPTKYGEDRIIKESSMTTMQFNPRTPSYVNLKLMMQEVEDEIDLIQFGQADLTEHYQLNIAQQMPSSWTTDLME